MKVKHELTREKFLSNIVRTELGTDIKVAEIGVLKGKFAKEMINSLLPSEYIGIDPYKKYFDKPCLSYHRQITINQVYENTNKLIEGLGHKLYRMTSEEAAPLFYNNYFDLVYLDGDHRYEFVKQDIELWYDKIKIGGILSGHDYVKRPKRQQYGVIKAVDEFVQKEGLELNINNEEWTTWWVYKK